MRIRILKRILVTRTVCQPFVTHHYSLSDRVRLNSTSSTPEKTEKNPSPHVCLSVDFGLLVDCILQFLRPADDQDFAYCGCDISTCQICWRHG